MAGRGKAKVKGYEAKNRAGDKRTGTKEGTSRDTRTDSKAPSTETVARSDHFNVARARGPLGR
jgi:hypothetical protein